MQTRHQDRRQYFDEQAETTRKFVIPYIERARPVTPDLRVLEIGCGEGGNLVPFAAIGCECVGVDLAERQIERAREYFVGLPGAERTCFYYQDIYKAEDTLGRFDLIFLRDVIEHIIDQDRFMGFIGRFLRPGGLIFFGFPPWYMPFGGHQQICRSFLAKVPWVHLLPAPLYGSLLRAAGELPGAVEELQHIKQTGISIERFRRILHQHDYRIVEETLYLVNPNYETKFGLTPREQFPLLGHIPGVRNFVTTCCYCLVQKSGTRSASGPAQGVSRD